MFCIQCVCVHNNHCEVRDRLCDPQDDHSDVHDRSSDSYNRYQNQQKYVANVNKT